MPSALQVWSGCASGQLLGQHQGHTGPVNCLALDGNLLFSGSHDTTIAMWDVLPAWFVAASAAVTAPVAAAAPASRGRAGCSTPALAGAAAVQARAGVHCRGREGEGRDAARLQPVSRAFRVMRGHTSEVNALHVLSSTGLLLSCGQDGQVLQWNYFTGQLLAATSAPGQGLTCLAAVHQPVADRDACEGCAKAYVGTAAGQLLCFGVSSKQPLLELAETSC